MYVPAVWNVLRSVLFLPVVSLLSGWMVRIMVKWLVWARVCAVYSRVAANLNRMQYIMDISSWICGLSRNNQPPTSHRLNLATLIYLILLLYFYMIAINLLPFSPWVFFGVF
jgi:hypothetical protein